jgi:hypothetical protein
MGTKKIRHTEKEQAKLNYTNLVDELFSILKPYTYLNGKLNLFNDKLTKETSVILARILDSKIAIEDNDNSKYFCSDDILAKQVIVENGGLIKYWGIIYWLNTHKEYEINKTGQDPFYAEFRIFKNKLTIEKMKCGDFKKTNVEKVLWFDTELDWRYEFEG